MEVGIGFIGIRCRNRRWSWTRTINETEEILASEIGYNLSLPEKIVVPGKFNGDEMVDNGKRGGDRRGGDGGSSG